MGFPILNPIILIDMLRFIIVPDFCVAELVAKAQNEQSLFGPKQGGATLVKIVSGIELVTLIEDILDTY